MQALIDMGYGDVKIPVSMWPREYMGDPYSTRGNNEQVNEAFKDVMIFPESEGEEMIWSLFMGGFGIFLQNRENCQSKCRIRRKEKVCFEESR